MSVVAVVSRAVLPIVGGRRQRDLGGGFSLGSGAAEQRSRSRENPGGLGAHAQNAAAARRQDFEVELVEAHTELFSGPPQSLLHGLAREFVVSVAIGSHVSVVSLVDPLACACWAEPLRPPMPIAPPA
jgi:hypothetical protein